MPMLPLPPSVAERCNRWTVSRRTKRFVKRSATGLSMMLIAVVILMGAMTLGHSLTKPVNPTLAATINPMLDAALPADLDRFSIGGDLSTLADCEGHVADQARARYGDSLLTIGGNVQSYESRAFAIPIEAERTASGHWALTAIGVSPRDASPADVQTQITTCAAALARRMNHALANNALRNRNAAAWTNPGQR